MKMPTFDNGISGNDISYFCFSALLLFMLGMFLLGWRAGGDQYMKVIHEPYPAPPVNEFCKSIVHDPRVEVEECL